VRIKVEGWHRNHGERELFVGQLADAQITVGPGEIAYEGLQLQLSPDPPTRPSGGRVIARFRIDTREAPLNGEYLMSVILGKKDIAKLYRSAFGDMTLNQLESVFDSLEAEAA
jgi:hypothetical protein